MPTTEGSEDRTAARERLDQLIDLTLSPSKVSYESDLYLRIEAESLMDLYDLICSAQQAGFPPDTPLLEPVTLYLHRKHAGTLSALNKED